MSENHDEALGDALDRHLQALDATLMDHEDIDPLDVAGA